MKAVMIEEYYLIMWRAYYPELYPGIIATEWFKWEIHICQIPLMHTDPWFLGPS